MRYAIKIYGMACGRFAMDDEADSYFEDCDDSEECFKQSEWDEDDFNPFEEVSRRTKEAKPKVAQSAWKAPLGALERRDLILAKKTGASARALEEAAGSSVLAALVGWEAREEKLSRESAEMFEWALGTGAQKLSFDCFRDAKEALRFGAKGQESFALLVRMARFAPKGAGGKRVFWAHEFASGAGAILGMPMGLQLGTVMLEQGEPDARDESGFTALGLANNLAKKRDGREAEGLGKLFAHWASLGADASLLNRDLERQAASKEILALAQAAEERKALAGVAGVRRPAKRAPL